MTGLWCRTRPTSICGARISSVPSDARDRSLAPVGILPPECGARRSDFRGRDSAVRQGAGTELLQGVQLVLNLPHPSPPRCRFATAAAFLGDAAHIHSPVGAQGMKRRLQDAYNLAGNSALVVGTRVRPCSTLRGRVSRRSAAAELDRPGVFAGRSDSYWRVVPHAHPGEDRGLAMSVDRIRTFAFAPSQIGVSYRHSLYRKRWRACLPRRRAPAIVFRGCGSNSGRTVPPRICSDDSTTRDSI